MDRETTATLEADEISGAEMVVRALRDQGVKHIFGYPGGAVLPIYDALFQQEDVEHVLVRHEQGAPTPRKAMRARPASRASCWSPPAPARRTPSPASPTR